MRRRAARGSCSGARRTLHHRAADQRCGGELVPGCRVAVAKHLLEVVAHAAGANKLDFATGAAPPVVAAQHPDLCEVRGQVQAKRALEIAAAGEHSLLLIGPPGTGKSMLAQRLPGLLPPMSEAEALEVAAIRSCRRLALRPAHWRVRPFRSPHHTASAVASSAVARVRALAKCRSLITACCSSTSCRNSIAPRWKCCASRSRAAASRFRARRSRRSFRRHSS